MNNNFIFLFVYFFLVQFVTGQSNVEKLIEGKLMSNTISPVEEINITNTSSKIMVVSDQYGRFSILVKEGDILSFSAINYEPLRKIINRTDFNTGNITVHLTPLNVELEEVIINKNSNITAENLGIIPKDQIKLTTAERRLATASYSQMNPMGLDPLINKISGRTKMLKKVFAIEKKEFLMVKLENMFDAKYYIETLKIPEELIRGFQYYCIENADFAKSLNNKNKTMSMFLIVGLASEFNKKRVIDEK